jgi:hypothetical protein
MNIHFRNNPLLCALHDGLRQVFPVPPVGTVREDGRILTEATAEEHVVRLVWSLPDNRPYDVVDVVLCATPEELARGQRDLADVRRLCQEVADGWATGQGMKRELEVLRLYGVKYFDIDNVSCPWGGVDRRYNNSTVVREGMFFGAKFTWFPGERPYIQVNLEA